MTRKFWSYGSVNTQLHYYAPRTELIDKIYHQLSGEATAVGGHYITVWAPRQTGKTWVMQQAVQKIREEGRFETLITTMQSGKSTTTPESALGILVENLRNRLNIDFPSITTWEELRTLFTPQYLHKPLILILDEFDAFLQVFEAVYHFNLFTYLVRFLESRRGQVTSEFPTGNGQIDLLIRYTGQIYGVELKSFVDAYDYKRALGQAARYAQKLHLPEITLVFFVEAVDDENRRKFEAAFVDPQTGVKVEPIFVATGA